MTIQNLKFKILPVLKGQGVLKASIFGSFARGDSTSKSDVDILVELSDDVSLFDFVGIKLEIEDIIGKKVDLVEYKVIKPRIKKNILADEVRIL